MKTRFLLLLILAALVFLPGCCLFAAEAPAEIVCEGLYDGHLQGVATDGAAIYWSFTKQLVKTDRAGAVLAVTNVPSHHGDLCVKDGVVYVAVNLGRFNFENRAKSFVYSYAAADLAPRAVWPVDLPHGAGGMTWKDDRFYLVGGLPATHERNYVYEYTADFTLVKRHELATGFTLMGIQTAAYEQGCFFFGVYGVKGCPAGVLTCPADLSGVSRTTGFGDLGILALDGLFYTGRTWSDATGRYSGKLVATPNFPGKPYAPTATGKGRYVVFFEGHGAEGWRDAGYALGEDGYAPLFNSPRNPPDGTPVFTPCKDADLAPLSAIGIGGARRYSVGDLVRGLRRAALLDEVLALHVPGTPETVGADPQLQITLDALAAEAARLGVKVETR